MIEFTVKENLKELNEDTNGYQKRLSLVKWGTHDTTLDIRTWRDKTPCKGITLTEPEARELYEGLKEYFEK